jgi:hypothetical protein
MEGLVTRARAAMNLVLIATILLAWGLFRDSPNVIQLGLNIYELAKASEESDRPSDLKYFLDTIEVTLSKDSSTEKAIGLVKVTDILAFSDANL